MGSDIVYISKSNQALTNSLLVAKTFEKSHKDVMKAIKNLIAKAQNCAVVDYQKVTSMFFLDSMEQVMPVGGGFKKMPYYIMNRDGFTLLAMGFTGAKALEFQLKYIQAFNAMESRIKEVEIKRIEEEKRQNELPKDFFLGLFNI